MSSFHLTCAFMGALGKKMRCSGFEEVLIESGICASGLIAQVLTGKHCNHALCVHKVVYVVVNFLSQVIFIFPLFLGMVMYANEFKTKEK